MLHLPVSLTVLIIKQRTEKDKNKLYDTQNASLNPGMFNQIFLHHGKGERTRLFKAQ